MGEVLRCGKPQRDAAFERPLSLQWIDAILDEARALSDRVVKPARDGVGLVRVPEHARRARFLCRIDDGRDQRPAHAAAPGGFADIEVLEIALRIQKPRAALKQIVSEADKFAVALSDQRMHRLEGIENARESRIGDVVAPLRAVKNEISAPQRRPLRTIRAVNRAHLEVCQSPPSPLLLDPRYAREDRGSLPS